MKNVCTAIVFAAVCSISLFAQNSEIDADAKRIAIGLQVGINRGANESSWESRQTIQPVFGLFGLFRNGLGAGLSPELNIGINLNKSSAEGGFSDYKTNYTTADIRLRWYPMMQDSKFSPYISAGAGLIMNSNVDPKKLNPFNVSGDFKENAATLQFPITGGLTHNLTDNIGLDINLGWMLSLTDDINPAHDGTNDGAFLAKIGFMYSFAPIEKDSDEDGLTDKYEMNVSKTDPNNPDTDGDGLRDGDEVNIHKTDPLNKDTDDGGVDDGVEVRAGTDPLDLSDDISSIEVGQTIQIRNIEFETAKSDITPKSERILNTVLKILNTKPDMNLDISGHTDNTGSREFNMTLSNDRAASVKAWLVAKGVDGARLSTGGLGPDKPIATNDTPDGRRRNRRVEFRRTK
ncbi:MAG: OmpA family protein [Candidatus Kapabacteria bacterium]|nr:OmpA family protein [Candidatus Kapabacteria bacterium]